MPSDVFRAKLEIVQARMAAQEEKRQLVKNVRKFKIDQKRREEQKRLEEQERERIRKKFAENRKLKFEKEAARRREEERLQEERMERLKKVYEELKRANDRQQWVPRKRARRAEWPLPAEQRVPWRRMPVCFDHNPFYGNYCNNTCCRNEHLDTNDIDMERRFNAAMSAYYNRWR